MGGPSRECRIREDGYGEFFCRPISVRVYVNKAADGREKLGKSYSSESIN